MEEVYTPHVTPGCVKEGYLFKKSSSKMLQVSFFGGFMDRPPTRTTHGTGTKLDWEFFPVQGCYSSCGGGTGLCASVALVAGAEVVLELFLFS